MTANIRDINPYPNVIYNWIDIAAHKMMRPWKHVTDIALSCFLPTTKEWQNKYYILYSIFILFPLCLMVSLLLLPVGLCGIITWSLICDKRRPYRMSVCSSPPVLPSGAGVKTTYSFGTANVCLLQEFISRFNNLSDTYFRAVEIGKRIKDQQLGVECELNNKTNGKVKLKHKNGITHSQNGAWKGVNKNGHAHLSEIQYYDGMDVGVKEGFPFLDFMFLQETWDTPCARALSRGLHHIFPFIIYDVGENGLFKNGFANNSALMCASRYPILDVRFQRYTHSCRQCRLASKGLLQVKVFLGQENGKTVVGYLNNTHLQVFQGSLPIHQKQLDQVEEWTDTFRRDTLRENDQVAFDILGGDFNLDNMCPVDKHEWRHPIFSKYVDVCRKRPGEDHPFTIGTAMRQTPLLDKAISTPEGLRRVLENPAWRRYYIQDADLRTVSPATCRMMPPLAEDGWPKPAPSGGRRRLDYLMYRKDTPVTVKAINPVTLLAGLTDHVLVNLTIETNTE